MRNVSAFTIIELLVAMTLSIIVTILAFYGYTLIQGQFLSFRKYSSTVEEYNLFISSLQKDVESAQAVIVYERTLQLTIEEKYFSYQFEDTISVRKNPFEEQKADTFKVSANLGDTYFEEKYREQGLIDKLEIQIKLFDRHTNLQLHKWYSAEELMQYEH